MSAQGAPRSTGTDGRVLAVVHALESHGLLDPDRHGESLSVVGGALGGEVAEHGPLRRRLAEVAGYVGAALVLAAAALFVADQWLDLGVAQQLLLLAGVAVVLAVAGVATALTGDSALAGLKAGLAPARRRLAGVLLTGAAVATAAAVVVWVDDMLQQRVEGWEWDWLVPLLGGTTLALVAAAGYLLAPSVVGQGGIATGLLFAAPGALSAGAEFEPVALGVAYLVIGLVWLLLAERHLWSEPVPARVIGALFVVVGAQVPVGSDHAWVGYLLTLVVAVAGFGMYLGRRSWPYLAVGVVGVTLAVPEALLDWTEGSLGTAGVLLVAGATLLGASLLGLRLRQEVTEDLSDDMGAHAQR